MKHIFKKNNYRIGIVSNDAGGAELISSYIKHNDLVGNCLFALEGPSKKIFKSKFPDIHIMEYRTAIDNSDFVICGTGWQSNFEWDAIYYSNKSYKYVCVYLDHWVNYQDRFVRGGVSISPSEIWVGDKYAREIARKSLGQIKIRFIKNRNISEFVDAVNSISRNICEDKSTALYLCENIKYNGFMQFDAIDFFVNRIDELPCKIKNLIIRPHPSEDSDKYNILKQKYQQFNVIISSCNTLAADVASSAIVVGCSSMGLVLASMAGKKVYSFIPGEKYPYMLPECNIVLVH